MKGKECVQTLAACARAKLQIQELQRGAGQATLLADFRTFCADLIKED